MTNNALDPVTGMWIVHPEMDGNTRVTSIVPLTSITRACHLLPVLGNTYLPAWFHVLDALDTFNAYYVNSLVDYHAHETLL